MPACLLMDILYTKEMGKSKEQIINDLNTGWKMWLYFFSHLPVIIFFGIRIKNVGREKAEVSIPFRWTTKNPFKSIYAGAQFAAGEISTGLLAKLAIEGRGKISMLITHIGMEYTKKATSLTTFTCEDGALFERAIDKMLETGESQIVEAKSIGTMQNGEVVSIMKFEWSFKLKES